MTTRPATQFDSLADVRAAEIDDENARRALAYPRLVEALREVEEAYGCECVDDTHHCPMCQARALLRSLGEIE
jgi:hypothetical protein